MPFATIAFFCSLYFVLKAQKTLFNILAFVILVVFAIFGFNVQAIASGKILSAHVRDLNREEVFDWLRANTPKDSVVGSINTDFESLIPAYTDNRVFFPPTDRTITPTYEGVTRYTIVANLLGISLDWQKKNLDKIISYLFVYQSYDDNRSLNLSSNKRKESEDEINIQAQGLWKESLKKYQLDYVVVTPEEMGQIKIDPNSLKKEVTIGNYYIYTMNK